MLSKNILKNLVPSKSKLNIFYLLGLAMALIVAFQNCAPEGTSGDLFSVVCEDCVGPENVNELSIQVPQLVTVGLPLPTDTQVSNFEASGTCNNGNFTENRIRWQIRDNRNNVKYYGVTQCVGTSGTYAIRQYIPRYITPPPGGIASGIIAGNYKLYVQIFGVAGANKEIAGPDSSKNFNVYAENTIAPPKLLSYINAQGGYPNTTPPPANLWAPRFRVVTTVDEIQLSTVAKGLCTYIQGQTNNVLISLSKYKVEPVFNTPTPNHVSVRTTCTQLPAPVAGYSEYTGFFFLKANLNPPEDVSFFAFNGAADYEGCALSPLSQNLPVCVGVAPVAPFTKHQNRFYDLTVSQVDPIVNIPAKDKKVVAFVFENSRQYQFNAKSWNYDIFLETLKRIKIGLTLLPNVIDMASNTNLNSSDLSNAAQIFQTTLLTDNFDEDFPTGAPSQEIREGYSLRSWVLDRFQLRERRSETLGPNGINAPLKVSDSQDQLKNIIYQRASNNLADGSACGTLKTGRLIFGLDGATVSAGSIEAQRIALCIAVKFSLGMFGDYKEVPKLNALAAAAENGVRYTNPPNRDFCKVDNSNATDMVGNEGFCQNLALTYGRIRGFLNLFLGNDVTFASTTDINKKAKAAEAIGQLLVNDYMFAVSSNEFVMKDIIKDVLRDADVADFANNQALFDSVYPTLRPRELNFVTPLVPGVVQPFAAYTSLNTPGSVAGATGSYTP